MLQVRPAVMTRPCPGCCSNVGSSDLHPSDKAKRNLPAFLCQQRSADSSVLSLYIFVLSCESPEMCLSLLAFVAMSQYVAGSGPKPPLPDSRQDEDKRPQCSQMRRCSGVEVLTLKQNSFTSTCNEEKQATDSTSAMKKITKKKKKQNKEVQGCSWEEDATQKSCHEETFFLFSSVFCLIQTWGGNLQDEKDELYVLFSYLFLWFTSMEKNITTQWRIYMHIYMVHIYRICIKWAKST